MGSVEFFYYERSAGVQNASLSWQSDPSQVDGISQELCFWQSSPLAGNAGQLSAPGGDELGLESWDWMDSGDKIKDSLHDPAKTVTSWIIGWMLHKKTSSSFILLLSLPKNSNFFLVNWTRNLIKLKVVSFLWTRLLLFVSEIEYFYYSDANLRTRTWLTNYSEHKFELSVLLLKWWTI